MICQNCEYCKGIKDDRGQLNIACELNGSIKVHTDYKDRYRCESYIKSEKPKEPSKPNIVVVLKKGTDIQVYSEMIRSTKALVSWWDTVDKSRFVVIGNFIFMPEDIAAIGYIQ